MFPLIFSSWISFNSFPQPLPPPGSFSLATVRLSPASASLTTLLLFLSSFRRDFLLSCRAGLSSVARKKCVFSKRDEFALFASPQGHNLVLSRRVSLNPPDPHFDRSGSFFFPSTSPFMDIPILSLRALFCSCFPLPLLSWVLFLFFSFVESYIWYLLDSPFSFQAFGCSFFFFFRIIVALSSSSETSQIIFFPGILFPFELDF